MYNLTRNEETLIGFVVEGIADMHAIQAWCDTANYGCNVNLPIDGAPTINVISPGGAAMPGAVGDWAIIKNGVQITLVPAQLGPSLYTVVGPV
jgi:hypothetical protein